MAPPATATPLWRRPSVVAAFLGVAALLALLAYGLGASGTDDSVDSRLAGGRPAAAPAFELGLLTRGSLGPLASKLAPALADGRVATNELRVPVVLNFWASWCPPCRTEAPALERAWKTLRAEGVLMLGLNMQDVTGDARGFVRGLGLSYPNVRDGTDGVATDWGVSALPETFFLDRRGRIVGHVIGEISGAQLRQGVEAARSGRVLGSRSGGDRRETR